MSVHTYDRGWNTTLNTYEIENPLRVDGEGNQIFLFNEVASAISGNPFNFACKGSEATFTFNTDLTPTEVTTLDTTVSNHKNNI